MNNAEKLIIKSNLSFKKHLLEKVKKVLNADRIISVEEKDTALMILFDTEAGVDFWKVENRKGMRGIASRIQWGEKNWKSFTIREQTDYGTKNTELNKRIRAINENYLYPYYTIQGYIDDTVEPEKLLGFAIAKTVDIFTILANELIKNGLDRKPNPKGAWFYPVFWHELKKRNKWCYIYPEINTGIKPIKCPICDEPQNSKKFLCSCGCDTLNKY